MREAGLDLKGRKPAGFRFTPSGEAEWALALDQPLHLVPGGGLSLIDRANRRSVQPLDGSQAPEVWKIGGNAKELSAILRYQRFPAELQDALRASADGLRLDYYPRLEATNWFFPVRVVGVGPELRAEEDPARYVLGEYRWRELRIRHLQTGEGNNGNSFAQLLTGNLLLGPRFYRDSDGDGVADHWSAQISGSPSGTRSIDQRGQKVSMSSAPAGGEEFGVVQAVYGALAGDVYELEVSAQVANLVATAEGRVLVDAMQGDGSFIQTIGSLDVSAATFARSVLETSAAPANTGRVRVRPQVKAQAAGDTGDLWARDADLRRVGES